MAAWRRRTISWRLQLMPGDASRPISRAWPVWARSMVTRPDEAYIGGIEEWRARRLAARQRETDPGRRGRDLKADYLEFSSRRMGELLQEFRASELGGRLTGSRPGNRALPSQGLAGRLPDTDFRHRDYLLLLCTVACSATVVCRVAVSTISSITDTCWPLKGNGQRACTRVVTCKRSLVGFG